ncbi:hypothetical protein [Nostoc sp. KVJ20]|uniref:hypothetical protein n=1 Tax=Nostoc sp. KVJ20 TaxID=457944 RepID=UPI00083DC412|nr:hypothetical protein [Nostoc sp. KVJ20]
MNLLTYAPRILSEDWQYLIIPQATEFFWLVANNNTHSINDCNTSLGKDAMNRVSTNGLFVAFFFKLV